MRGNNRDKKTPRKLYVKEDTRDGLSNNLFQSFIKPVSSTREIAYV